MSYIAVAGMGTSVAGSIFGAIKSAKEQKANQAILNQQIAESKTDANKSFLDSATAKDATRVANENLVDTRKNVAGRAAVTGASDEAVVASNSSANKAYGDALSRIAGMGTSYQERAKSRTNSLLGEQMQINNQKAESASAMAANAGELVGTSAMMGGMAKPEAGAIAKTGGQGITGVNGEYIGE